MPAHDKAEILQGVLAAQTIKRDRAESEFESRVRDLTRLLGLEAAVATFNVQTLLNGVAGLIEAKASYDAQSDDCDELRKRLIG